MTDPVPTDLPWRKVESLFKALGASVKYTDGSKVRVTLEGRDGTFHKPHNDENIKRYAVRDIRRFLNR